MQTATIESEISVADENEATSVSSVLSEITVEDLTSDLEYQFSIDEVEGMDVDQIGNPEISYAEATDVNIKFETPWDCSTVEV